MKKYSFFSLLVALFLGLNLSGQGLYFEINAGYGFPSIGTNGVPYYGGYSLLGNSSYVSMYNYDNFMNTTTTTGESLGYSYGKGLNFRINAGYDFNKFIGGEIGFAYMLGSSMEVSSYDSYGDVSGGTIVDLVVFDNSYEVKGKMFQIVPAIVVSPGFDKFNPYVKFGVIVGFGSYAIDWKQVHSATNEPTETREQTFEFSKGVSVGLSSSLGVQYKFSVATCLFLEANFSNVSYSPKKGELTKSTENGINELPMLTTRDKNIEFVKEFTETRVNYNPDENKPRQELKYSVPFSTIGVNLGVRINLGRK